MYDMLALQTKYHPEENKKKYQNYVFNQHAMKKSYQFWPGCEVCTKGCCSDELHEFRVWHMSEARGGRGIAAGV